MYAVGLYGYLLLRRTKPWRLIGTALGMMLANILLFTLVSNVSWQVPPLVIQLALTAALSASIWHERPRSERGSNER
jgi:hypothetical protein